MQKLKAATEQLRASILEGFIGENAIQSHVSKVKKLRDFLKRDEIFNSIQYTNGKTVSNNVLKYIYFSIYMKCK